MIKRTYIGLFLAAAAALLALFAAWHTSMAQEDAGQDGAPPPLTEADTATTVEDLMASTPPGSTQSVMSGVIPGLPEGTMLVEGDILIKIEDFVRRYPSLAGNQPDSLQGTYYVNTWPNGRIPFDFNANVTDANREQMRRAMAWWERVAGIDFVECVDNPCTGDFVRVGDSNVNFSAIGRAGNMQTIQIVSWNNLAIIAHELGHTLGLAHEQNRPGRNNFVTINFGNVCKADSASCDGGFCRDGMGNPIDCDFNFFEDPNAKVYGAYDFDSVMHYRRREFSRNGMDTIFVRPPNNAQWQDAIGQRDHLSGKDINVAGCLYPHDNWRWVNPNAGGIGLGSCDAPFISMSFALNNVPEGGTLWLEPATYTDLTYFTKPMTLKAPNGGVILKP